jgi:hypothetical protein
VEWRRVLRLTWTAIDIDQLNSDILPNGPNGAVETQDLSCE